MFLVEVCIDFKASKSTCTVRILAKFILLIPFAWYLEIHRSSGYLFRPTSVSMLRIVVVMKVRRKDYTLVEMKVKLRE